MFSASEHFRLKALRRFLAQVAKVALSRAEIAREAKVE
jgi:hypothetical protein